MKKKKDPLAVLRQLTTASKQEDIIRLTKAALGLKAMAKIDFNSAAHMIVKVIDGKFRAVEWLGIKVNEALTTEQKKDALLDQLVKAYEKDSHDSPHDPRVARFKV